MHDVYNYIPETNHVSRVCSVAVGLYLQYAMLFRSRSQWPRGLRGRSTAARLLRLWVRIPPRAWMFVL